MCRESGQTKAWTAGVWLIGLGILFATKLWWPGILILIGIAAIVRGSTAKDGVGRIHGGLWAIFIGVWAALRFNMAFFLISMGIFLILKSTVTAPEPEAGKPYFDSRLE